MTMCPEIREYHVEPSISEDEINARYEEVLKDYKASQVER